MHHTPQSLFVRDNQLHHGALASSMASRDFTILAQPLSAKEETWSDDQHANMNFWPSESASDVKEAPL
ncbi:hypothetical protein WAI453_012996 [Rhynchosporium graminicola]